MKTSKSPTAAEPSTGCPAPDSPAPLAAEGSGLRTRSRKRPRGIAIVTVLSILVLMTVMVVGFFSLAIDQEKISASYAEGLRTRWLKDIALNMVVGQIRSASTAPDTVWVSQPGAVRTINVDNPDATSIFKLYSAATMTARSTDQIFNTDIPANWKAGEDLSRGIRSSKFVDLNEPIYDANGFVHFPIADPRAFANGGVPDTNPQIGGDRTRAADTPDGAFVDQTAVDGFSVDGDRRLPMPVAWLYVTQDGSFGTVNEAGSFQPTAGGSRATASNPIIGRIAFWTDDETAKININTAAEGIYWSPPHADNTFERDLARNQPVKHEYQRYPGHPATTSLSAVFAPGMKLDPFQSTDTTESDARNARSIIQAIHDISPVVNIPGSLDSNPQDGFNSLSLAEYTQQAKLIHKTLLYASVDDLRFALKTDDPLISQSRGLNDEIAIESRPGLGTAARLSAAGDLTFAERLDRSKFFLTTRSLSPELNPWGQPKVLTWPMHTDVERELAVKNFNSPKATTVDRLLLYCSALAGEGYNYFRSDQSSRHWDFYGQGGLSGDQGSGDARERNEILTDWMGVLLATGIPGWGTSFGDKYGKDANFSDTKQIIAHMFDYIKCSNLYDPDLARNSDQYNDDPGNYGQSSGICMCGGQSFHDRRWKDVNQPFPRAMGRAPTISEIAIAITQAGAKPTSSGDGSGHWPDYVRENTGYLYEVAIIPEAFAPSHGWTMLYPSTYVFMSDGGSGVGQSIAPVIEFDNSTLKVYWRGPNPTAAATSPPNAYGLVANSTTVDTAEWIPWGGSMGPRVFGGTYQGVNRVMHYLVHIPAGKQSGTAEFKGFAQQAQSGGNIGAVDEAGARTFIGLGKDLAGGPGDIGTVEIMQGVNFLFPPFTFHMKLDNGASNARNVLGGNNKTTSVFNRLMLNSLTKPNSLGIGTLLGKGPADSDKIPDEDMIVESIVPAHGDYRLVATKRSVPGDIWTRVTGNPGFNHRLVEPSYSPAASISATDTSYIFDRPGRPMPRTYPPPDYPHPPRDNDSYASFRDYEHYIRANRFATYFNNFPDDVEKYIARPDLTGDFDNGVGAAPDGAYINRADEGFYIGMGGTSNVVPYFSKITMRELKQEFGGSGIPTDAKRPQFRYVYSPNKVMPSSMMFGSLPSLSLKGVPWHTLLFRPNGAIPDGPATKIHPAGGHYGEAGPKSNPLPADHLIAEMFWMPVVEPYAISDKFATDGKINMNYQILPFKYITRRTGLHAVMKNERMMAIPNDQAAIYKVDDPSTNHAVYRRPINVYETLKQFEDKFAQPRDNIFKSPSEICEIWLVPELAAGPQALQLGAKGTNSGTYERMEQFWRNHALTGDNTRERPYVTIYPRLTTRSNTYKVHFWVEAIKKARGSASSQSTFDPQRDKIVGQYRGSANIERKIDAENPDIPDYAERGFTTQTNQPSAADFYSYRITGLKKFSL
ncbi:hypothetical protein BH23VER1_BH23VER1_03070 [soil metagenome]